MSLTRLWSLGVNRLLWCQHICVFLNTGRRKGTETCRLDNAILSRHLFGSETTGEICCYIWLPFISLFFNNLIAIFSGYYSINYWCVLSETFSVTVNVSLHKLCVYRLRIHFAFFTFSVLDIQPLPCLNGYTILSHFITNVTQQTGGMPFPGTGCLPPDIGRDYWVWIDW